MFVYVRMICKISSACFCEHTPSASKFEESMHVTSQHSTYWTILLMSTSLNPVAMSIPTIVDATGTSADSQSLCPYAWSSNS